MFTMTDNKRKKLKQFAAMSRPKNSNREWNYMYFWAENQKEAKDKWATGEDAVILKNVQRWKKGLTQRRQCAGNGGHHSGKCDNAKYGDYIINGNMVLLCQGKDSSTAIQACNDLMDKIQ